MGAIGHGREHNRLPVTRRYGDLNFPRMGIGGDKHLDRPKAMVGVKLGSEGLRALGEGGAHPSSRDCFR